MSTLCKDRRAVVGSRVPISDSSALDSPFAGLLSANYLGTGARPVPNICKVSGASILDSVAAIGELGDNPLIIASATRPILLKITSRLESISIIITCSLNRLSIPVVG